MLGHHTDVAALLAALHRAPPLSAARPSRHGSDLCRAGAGTPTGRMIFDSDGTFASELVRRNDDNVRVLE